MASRPEPTIVQSSPSSEAVPDAQETTTISPLVKNTPEQAPSAPVITAPDGTAITPVELNSGGPVKGIHDSTTSHDHSVIDHEKIGSPIAKAHSAPDSTAASADLVAPLSLAPALIESSSAPDTPAVSKTTKTVTKADLVAEDAPDGSALAQDDPPQLMVRYVNTAEERIFCASTTPITIGTEENDAKSHFTIKSASAGPTCCEISCIEDKQEGKFAARVAVSRSESEAEIVITALVNGHPTTDDATSGPVEIKIGPWADRHTFLVFPTGIYDSVKRYFIMENVGDGYDGVVFTAKLKVPGKAGEIRKTVSVKLLPGRDQSRQEFEALQAIKEAADHPAKKHLVAMVATNFEDTSEEDTLFVMEHSHGNLMKIIHQPEWKKAGVFQDAAAQMMAGPQFIHEHKLTHRNIGLPPFYYTGVLGNDTFLIQLADLGHVERFSSLNDTTTGLRGPDGFRPPEVYIKKPYNPFKADVGALGICYAWILEKTIEGLVVGARYSDSYLQCLTSGLKLSTRAQNALCNLLAQMLTDDAAARISSEAAKAHSSFAHAALDDSSSITRTDDDKLIYVDLIGNDEENSQPVEKTEFTSELDVGPASNNVELVPSVAGPLSSPVTPTPSPRKRRNRPSNVATSTPKKLRTWSESESEVEVSSLHNEPQE